MKKLLAIVSAALMLVSCGSVPEQKHTRTLFCMDTYMTLTAYGDKADEALRSACDAMEILDEEWSVTNPNSEIYAANHAEGKTVPISEETEHIIKFAKEISQQTDGALDITIFPVLQLWGFTTDNFRVPDDSEIQKLLESVDCSKIIADTGSLKLSSDMMLDLGSVAKGYAAKAAADVLKMNGIKSAILDLGGNIQTIGLKPDGSEWNIGIRDPGADGIVGTVSVEDRSVVTSGGYERFFTQDGVTYHHILDPKTGKPANNGFASVTIIGEDGVNCDALSTSLFIMGPDKAEEYWKQQGGFDYIGITDSGELILTKSIADSFKLDSDHMGVKMTFVE